MIAPPPRPTLFPYTTLFRSGLAAALSTADGLLLAIANALSHDVYYKMINPAASTVKRLVVARTLLVVVAIVAAAVAGTRPRSEEHTSELQSQSNLVCRLLLD